MDEEEETREEREERQDMEREADSELEAILGNAVEMEAAAEAADSLEEETVEEISEDIAADNLAEATEPAAVPDRFDEVLTAVADLAEIVNALIERVDGMAQGLPSLLTEAGADTVGTGDDLDGGDGNDTDSVGAASLDDLINLETLDLV